MNTNNKDALKIKNRGKIMRAYKDIITFSEVSGPGVVVEFGKNWRLVFWSKAQYVACWDLGREVWFTPEWFETSSMEDNHCYEPIMDKKLKYTQVEIIESGDARARIHWHYALCNLNYEIFNGNTTADEYYTVYPDGIAVRKLVGWPGNESDLGGNPKFWEVGEWILVNGKGTTPEENLEKEHAFTLQNLKGDKIVISWPMQPQFQPLCKDYPSIADWDAYIGIIHVKDRPNPFIVVPRNKALFPYKPCASCHKDHPQFNIFPGVSTYKHWPIYEAENFVTGIDAGNDVGKVATHTSICCFGYSYMAFERPPRPTVWLYLTGATENASSTYLSELAASWINPAFIEVETADHRGRGITPYQGYKFSERAYTFKAEGDKLNFVMKPRVKVINPVFRIDNWKSDSVNVRVDDAHLGENEYRWHLTQGTLIVWLNREIQERTEFEITS